MLLKKEMGKLLAKKHLKMRLSYRDKPIQPIDSIAFNIKDHLTELCKIKFGEQLLTICNISSLKELDLKEHFSKIAAIADFDILYHVEENIWNNIANLQLNIKDIKICE
jgi:hypothetical protein